MYAIAQINPVKSKNTNVDTQNLVNRKIKRSLNISEEFTLSKEKQDYIEEVGMFLENTGFQRMMGRVLAALWVAEHEIVSADHLASMLKASRGSISTSTRTLEQVGLIERVSIAGERKDYFRSIGNSWTRMLELEMQRTTALRMLVEKGLDLVESNDTNHSLSNMHEFLSYMEEELPIILDRWRQRQAEKAA